MIRAPSLLMSFVPNLRPAQSGAVQVPVLSDTTLDPVDLFRVLYRAASSTLDTSGFYLGLYDQGSQMVEIVRQMDSGSEFPGGAFPLGNGLTSQVIRTRKAYLAPNWSERGLPVQLQYATDRGGLPESALTVPIIGPTSDAVLGIISVQSYVSNAYDEQAIEHLEVLAAAAAPVLEAWQRRDRSVAESARRSSELETILASMGEGLLITDAQGAIVRLNAAARALLVPLADRIVLGQALDCERLGEWALRDRRLGDALAALVTALRRGEHPEITELDLWHDGHRTLSLSASLILSATGEPAGGVIVIRDVTQQRALDRVKARVLQIASHDLQAPLTVVKGRAQVLERRLDEGIANPEWLRDGLRAIVAQSDRVSSMLRMLLDLSLVSGGRIDLRITKTDLVPVVKQAAEEAAFLSDHHMVRVVAPKQVVGEWDATRLGQVLQNLISNAIKYSPGGGQVTVRVRVTGAHVEVAVRDRGIGLRPEEANRVFDQFYRAADARNLEGSGLGLYICQAIVGAHGGQIFATSPGLGRGSTFTFVLPLKSAAAEQQS